jgi:hypothetical protein
LLLRSVTRTGIDYQNGVVPVQPGTSNLPPAGCIEMGSIPMEFKMKKARCECIELFHGELQHLEYEYYALIRRQFHGG